MHARTAILLFSRSAAAEAAQKRFGAGVTGNQRIASALLQRTRRTLSRTGLPVIWLDESQQRGDSFGERLSEAISDGFAQGYAQLLVVGNDAPGLTAGHLMRAEQLLNSGATVIVPNQRGGVALLGISRPQFYATDLVNLAWETSDLLDSLQRQLPGCVYLGGLQDVNALSDLRKNWSQWRAPLATLSYLVLENRPDGDVWVLLRESMFADSAYRRGPPVERA